MTPGQTLLAMVGVVTVGLAVIGALDWYFVRQPARARSEDGDGR